MTIPDDDPHRDKDDVRRGAEAGARRLAAAIGGAIEGFVTALDEHDLAEAGRGSMETASEVAREAGREAKDVANAPEIREAGQAVARAAERSTEAAKARVEDAKEAVQERVDEVKDRASRATEDARSKARALAETGRRARVAPGRVAREMSGALRAWRRGIATAIAAGLAIAVFAIVTLVVLTIALVSGLNQVLGDPRGTWLTVAIYAVAMLVAWGVMKVRRQAARLETRDRLERSKAEAEHVAQPVRSAFGGGKRGAY